MTARKIMKDTTAGRRDVFFESRTGKRKSINEDCFGESVSAGGDLDFLYVSDGMGGHLAGEVASKMTCDALASAFSEAVFDDREMEKLFIENAVIKADLDIAGDSASNADHSRMGATLVLAALDFKTNTALVCNVGDSRCYFYGEDGIRQITKDHSVKQQLIDRGFSPEEIPLAAHRNAVTRAMGFLCTEKGRPHIDFYEVPFRENDVFMLCSDGLSSVLSDEILENKLSECGSDSLANICVALADMAEQAGSSDDITVALVRILKAETSEETADENEDTEGPTQKNLETEGSKTGAGTDGDAETCEDRH